MSDMLTELKEENLRMRHMMQKDTVEIAKLKLRVAELEKELKNAQQPPNTDGNTTGDGAKLGSSQAESPSCRPPNGDIPHATS